MLIAATALSKLNPFCLNLYKSSKDSAFSLISSYLICLNLSLTAVVEPKLRLFIRDKDWCPSVYTKVVKEIPTQIIEDAFYKIVRVEDNLEVVPYGTGSNLHTQLSFDVSGSYFDLDMGMLDGDYAYGVKFAFYNGAIGTWVEQPDMFKFRVEEQQI